MTFLCVFMLLCFIYFTRNRSGSLMIQFDVIKFWQNFDMFYKMLHWVVTDDLLSEKQAIINNFKNNFLFRESKDNFAAEGYKFSEMLSWFSLQLNKFS